MLINSIDNVVSSQLCTGCGICEYIEPNRYRMGDSLEFGRRPFLKESPFKESFEALKVCPGINLTHPANIRNLDNIDQNLVDGWGPVYGVWEGYSNDDELRLSGSSGGMASALSLFCLEKEGMSGVLHTGVKKDVPFLNETVMSTTREQLLQRTGSRYAPASPAEGLGEIEKSEKKCVFIGKPCDVAAVQNARKLKPALDNKIGLTIAFFCAGTPSIKGTLDLLRNQGISDLTSVKELRYRGNGWPGMWKVRYSNKNGLEETCQQTYADSWAFLQKYRQWRCYICPDHTGEFADVAVGDPWYREVQKGEPGKSLIVARTQRGLDIIKAAEHAGYIVLEKHDSSLLPLSQKNLMATRGALWGRLKVLRLFYAAVPNFSGFHFFRFWVSSLTIREKVQSFYGTYKRIFVKSLNKKIVVREWFPPRGK